MIILAKYGVAFTFPFPIPKAGLTDLAATADWTPATGDTKISKDEGNVANTTNNPAATGGTGSVLWNLTLTATEMQAARIAVQIVDAAVEDQVIHIYTYGNASAQHAFDLDTANVTVGTNNDKTGYALSAAGIDSIIDEVIEGSTTLRQMIRLFASALIGKASGLGGATALYRDVGDTKNRITATVDADGNRSAITLDSS